MPQCFLLKMFVLGDGDSFKKSLDEIRTRIEAEYDLQVASEVVDLREYPDEAEKHQILAIPTLLKEPHPSIRVVGKFSEVDKIVGILTRNAVVSGS